MNRTFFLLAVALLAALTTLRGFDPGPVRTARDIYFDTLQRIAPRQDTGLPVRIVDIDETSLRALGQWPWPRSLMAGLVDALRELGAAVIIFDVIFAEPDRLSPSAILDDPALRAALKDTPWLSELAAFDNDRAFSEAMLWTPVILGISDAGETGAPPPAPIAGFVEIGEAPAESLIPLRSATPLVPALSESAAGVGSINVSPASEDGVIREVPVVWSGENGPVPSLALEGLRVAIGESTALLFALPGGGGMESVGLGGYAIPVGSDGQMRIHYKREADQSYIPAASVLDPAQAEALRPGIDGHIVFVGTSAAGLLDIRTTALGERVPGVSIHAQMVEQILSDTYLRRSDVIAGAELAAFLGLGLVVAAVMAFIGPLVSVIAGAVGAAGVLGASWYGFAERGVLIDATFPLVGGFLTFAILATFQYVVSDRERRLIRASFSKYVSDDVLAEIERKGHDLKLGGETRDVTVMFSDIRNFTPLSESMPAQDLVALLNALFTRLTDDILSGRGTVDKYIGDSIMAFWNAPLDIPQHRRAACLATLAMRQTLRDFNAARRGNGHAPIGLSMGLASGRASVGNIGSEARYNYSVIGDTVNVAARIEADCRHVDYDILATEDVARDAADLALLPAGALALKGVSARTPAFLVVGDADLGASAAFRELAAAHTLLLQALRAGTADFDERLRRCKDLGARVEPGLAGFYARLPDRRADFPDGPV